MNICKVSLIGLDVEDGEAELDEDVALAAAAVWASANEVAKAQQRDSFIMRSQINNFLSSFLDYCDFWLPTGTGWYYRGCSAAAILPPMYVRVWIEVFARKAEGGRLRQSKAMYRNKTPLGKRKSPAIVGICWSGRINDPMIGCRLIDYDRTTESK